MILAYGSKNNRKIGGNPIIATQYSGDKTISKIQSSLQDSIGYLAWHGTPESQNILVSVEVSCKK